MEKLELPMTEIYEKAFQAAKAVLTHFSVLSMRTPPTDEQVRQFIHFARLGVKVRLKPVSDGKTWLLGPNDKDLLLNSHDRDAMVSAAKDDLAGFSNKLIG